MFQSFKHIYCQMLLEILLKKTNLIIKVFFASKNYQILTKLCKSKSAGGFIFTRILQKLDGEYVFLYLILLNLQINLFSFLINLTWMICWQ